MKVELHDIAVIINQYMSQQKCYEDVDNAQIGIENILCREERLRLEFLQEQKSVS